MKVCRRETFNSAHRLYRPEWDDEKNFEVFGKCSHPNYHGHNYVLDVCIDGPIDPITGFVIDLKLVKDIVREHVTDRFDHRNLNIDCEEFEGIVPTAENIAKVIWDILNEKLSESLTDKFKLEIHLHETENNRVIYSGE